MSGEEESQVETKLNVRSRLNNNPSSPKIHVLISRIYEYFALHSKGDFVDMINLRILRWGQDPGLSKWA